jgi:hypothetical protein
MNKIFKKATAISYPCQLVVSISNLYHSIQPTLLRNPSAPFDVLDRPVLVDVHIHPAPPLATIFPPKRHEEH